MSTYHFTIPGRLPGLNDYIEAERTHRLKAAGMKANCERLIRACIRKQLGTVQLTPPVWISYRFIEPDRRRDKDNISGFAHKVIQDSLVKAKIIPNDGWNQIAGYKDEFDTDAKNPRIEVEVITIEDIEEYK